jgi:hypothetical protein
MNNESIAVINAKKDARAILLLKDLFDFCYPVDQEDLPGYWEALSKFMAHAKIWNPAVEELGVNLVCRKGSFSQITELPPYTGEITETGIKEALRIIVERPIKKQHLGFLAKKTLNALSEHAVKQYNINRRHRESLEGYFFVLASDIKGSEHEY